MEEKERKMKKSTKYLLIGTLVLFLSILGASMAYYLARVSGNLSGRAAGTGLDLTITPLSTGANDNGDLIPLDSDVETLQLAALGYQDKGACIDINGYSVCQIYRIRVSNKGSVPLTVNGTVNLYGANTPNIDCAKMDDEDSITNNNSCMGESVLASNVVLPANNHNDYYVMVYIKNLDEPQYDKGEFNGTVTFTSIDGKKVKGRFKHEDTIAEYITKLYNNAEKTTVHHNAYVLDGNSSTASGVNNTNNKVNSMLLDGEPTTPGTPSTIDYHYATSVGLMNDRLGGTSEGLDIGNIRYYGSSPNNYIDIGDYSKEVIKNWKIAFSDADDDDIPFNDYDGCISLFQAQNVTDEMVAERFGSLGITTLDQLCTVTETTTPVLWRIIGVFDGKLRIVRDDPIGEYSYDRTYISNDFKGVNQWGPVGEYIDPLGETKEYTGADIMKLLNPGHEENKDFDTDRKTEISVNNSLWWNSQSGKCYTGSNNKNTACDFTSSGLSEEAKKYVTDQTIYLGGFDYNDVASFPNQAYIIEHGNKVRQNSRDNIPRTTSWRGKVGLPYLSDYGYAADLNVCTDNLSNYSNSNCTNNNWLYLNNKDQFMIPPYIERDSGVVIVDSSGEIGNDTSTRKYSIRPVLTLSSDTYILEGKGTKDEPYKITD